MDFSSEVDAYCAGYRQGAQDARDGYSGAIENPDLGISVSYGWRYAQGYKSGYYFNLEASSGYAPQLRKKENT